MKNKKIFIALLILFLLALPLPCSAQCKETIALDDSMRLNDMVITLLMPPVRVAVHRYYEPYLEIEPTVLPYSGSKIIAIQGGEGIHEGVYNSYYTVTLDVLPYVGPHLSVGKDRLTLSVRPDGVWVTNYEHLESYELTPNYQTLLKKPLP
ncbi:MAG: DUF3888 domain-containing protein [Oscillospiraceae bacterium]